MIFDKLEENPVFATVYTIVFVKVGVINILINPAYGPRNIRILIRMRNQRKLGQWEHV